MWYAVVIVCILLLAYLILDIILSNYFISVALTRNKRKIKRYKKNLFIIPDKVKKQMNENKVKGEKWLNKTVYSEVKITSLGAKLGALQFRTRSHKWVILLHGYTGGKEELLHLAKWYYEQGYNVLLPDLRAHGISQGKYFGMGYLDRKDILHWIKYIVSKDETAKIVLHGHSMGAATALFTAGENSSHLVGCISDSAYTSVYKVFQLQIKALFKLPGHALLGTVNLLFGLRKGGYYINGGNVVKYTSEIKVPVLFMHGTKDDLLPVSMCDELYDACNSKKEKVILENSGHAQGDLEDFKFYTETIDKFLNKLF
jgi:hypothetical protein